MVTSASLRKYLHWGQMNWYIVWCSSRNIKEVLTLGTDELVYIIRYSTRNIKIAFNYFMAFMFQ